MVDTQNFPPGTTVNGRYTLLRRLGRDGSVYEVHDRHLAKDAALKFLGVEGADVDSWAEARLLERLRSRFTLEVINADVVTEADLRFIVTPLHSGGDCESNAANLGFSTSTAVRYAQQVSAGVSRIHAAGMVHRDIKPANVLIDEDCARVSDLEFCEVLGRDGKARPNGSYCTVAPEVLIDPGYCSLASDVYSLGATAFYFFSGVYPVDTSTPKNAQREFIIAGKPRRLRDFAPFVPMSVELVVRKALSSDPGARHPSADAFANALVRSISTHRCWKRVQPHADHSYCIEGEARPGKNGVSVCCVRSGERTTVMARHLGKNRRISGISDQTVRSDAAVSALQRMVKALS
ncbi:serine/threonine protein kinase [Arthrobacter sp. NamB2]|uniref:serine/threonine-protein kinase n=1 Tax=Arthrobacter sp. NamB2 TaxID=2576035 RepID=UPI0010C9B104|nr:serine/threonine protein kinase [Arthrobacter sp. NamB2]